MARVRMRWIVSPRHDLLFFVASCGLTWVFLGLYHLLCHLGFEVRGESVLITYFVFTALFDHPHIFQTFSRTHGDRRELARRRGLHTWGLAAFVVGGVAIAALGYLRQLIVFASLFGSWHIIRQHWGLLRAYKAVNDDHNRLDHHLDSTLFYVGMIGFLLNDYRGAEGPTTIYGDLTAPFPSVPPWLSDVAGWIFAAVAVLFVLRQVQLWRRGEPIVAPKLLFLTAALGTHGLVFYLTATPFLVAEALETVYHNVQYQGWIRHYQRRTRGAHVVRRWAWMAVAYGLVVGSVEVIGLTNQALSWLFLPFFMVVIYHYYVDGKIWRLGSDAELREAVLAR